MGTLEGVGVGDYIPWLEEDEEEWKPIKGFEGVYEVSNHGRVRSLPRKVFRSDGRVLPVKEKILHASRKRMYLEVNLSTKSKSRHDNIHVLVAEAFLKKPNWSDRVCHKDDNGHNNHVSNLYWGDASTNGKDAYRHGRHADKIMPKGEEVYNAISNKDVLDLRRLKEKGLTYKQIKGKTGWSSWLIKSAINGWGRFKNI
jgi:hypothetical protein